MRFQSEVPNHPVKNFKRNFSELVSDPLSQIEDIKRCHRMERRGDFVSRKCIEKAVL